MPRQRPLKEDAVHAIDVQAKVGQGMGRLQVEQGGKVAGIQFKVNEQGRLVLLARAAATVAASVLDPLPPLGARRRSRGLLLSTADVRSPPDQGGVELGTRARPVEVVVRRTAQGARTSLESRLGRRPALACPPAAADSPTIPALARSALDRTRGSPRAARAGSGPADRPPAQAERHARTGSSSPSRSKTCWI